MKKSVPPARPVAASSPQALDCLIVEDHTIVAQLLAGVVRGMAGIGSVFVAGTASGASTVAANGNVDLLLLDLKLPDGDGVDVLRFIARRHPGMQCIVLSSASDEFICPAEHANTVIATIDKTGPLGTLRRAIEEILRRRLGTAPSTDQTGGEKLLRARELEVFVRIGQGMTTRQIAHSMGITVHTVNTHRKAIVAKLGTVGADLVRIATLYNQRNASNSNN